MGFSEVRADVDSNLSTTTCNFPFESFAISWNRAAMASRAHPIPRFESVQDESDSLVPQTTSCLISARIDFSSTCARATPPAGRGNLLGCGLPCTGSAGSRGGVRCAATGIARRASRENDRPMKSREQGSDLFLGVVMICTTSMDVAFRESGILARTDAGMTTLHAIECICVWQSCSWLHSSL